MLGVVGYIALGIGATLLITASAFTIGGILAIPLALAQRSRFAFLRILVRGMVNLVRAVPPLRG